jgi:hypothetical protein
MLLHLPIAILVTLSPITVSDTVPNFDIVRECRFEGGQPPNSTAALRTKVLLFESFNRRGRSLPVPTKGIAWSRRRSTVSRAISS